MGGYSLGWFGTHVAMISFGVPAGNSVNPVRKTSLREKPRYDGRAVKTGHPGRNQTADARLVRAALWSLSYRAIVW